MPRSATTWDTTSLDGIWRFTTVCSNRYYDTGRLIISYPLTFFPGMFPFKSSELRCWMFANHSTWDSTTARPHGRYKPRSVPNKLVDFCVYANMDDDDQLMTALRALCRQTPTLSVNHTDFDPLQTRPIMFSIETKKTGEQLTKAQLQVGVWHAAKFEGTEIEDYNLTNRFQKNLNNARFVNRPLHSRREVGIFYFNKLVQYRLE